MKAALATFLLRLLAYLPWGLLRALGRWLGSLLYWLNGREASNVRVNLALAYPQLSESAREKLSKAVLQHSGMTFAELPRIWLRGVDDRVDGNGIQAEMDKLLAAGKGLILAMPHHGNWETIPSAMSPEVRITGLYRPPRQAWVEPIMTHGREISRIQMVPTDRRGIKALHDTLRQGDVVAILPDQVPKAAGAAAASAPFFGREAATMVLLGRLAARHQTPVLMAWAERQQDGRYQLQYFVADEKIADRDARTSAVALNQAVEQCIASAPAQYQWAYRRYLPVDDSQENPYH